MFTTAKVHGAVSAELEDELSQVELLVEGEVPQWLSGMLIRNGPINIEIDGKRNSHWFDGLAMLHAFAFHKGEVKYSNKFLRTDAYRSVFQEGSLEYTGFAVDPCRSLFKRFYTWFVPRDHFALPNANVNVAKIAEQYVALTEIPLPIHFDPLTLETLGVLNYEDALPKSTCWESAHPHRDIANEEMLSYLIEYGRESCYTVYRIADGSSARKVIARIPVETPAYMHSFAVTENYIVLTEFPFVVRPFEFITQGKPFIQNFNWEPGRGTQFIVINRKNGKVRGRYRTNAFFAFHHVNAYEESQRILFDIVAYKDPAIINGLSRLDGEDVFNPNLHRFTLDLKNGYIESEVLFHETAEFPRINESCDGKPHRYIYLSEAKVEGGPSRLYKFDAISKSYAEWAEPDCYPGEPVFIAKPNAEKEDEGVVAAVVLDKAQERSFLLILDGKSFKEIARATAPHKIPHGLHGQYFSSAL